MEYNTEKNIKRIRDLLFLAESDISTLRSDRLGEGVRLEASYEELEVMWRTLEMVEDYAQRARTLIGKMLDERDDMEEEDEGE